MKKTYIAIIRDKSGSMQPFNQNALNDYNSIVKDIQEQDKVGDIDNYVTVIDFGSVVNTEQYVTQARRLKLDSSYNTNLGSTALYDAVGSAIKVFQELPGPHSESSFLIMVLTDGQENSSKAWRAFTLSADIKALQWTDRWTFTFRVPRGYASQLVADLGIHSGNVVEWDQTESGWAATTDVQTRSLGNYYDDQRRGLTSTKTFFVQPDAKVVKAAVKNKALNDISHEIQVLKVDRQEQIRDFMERKTGKYLKGAAYYELTKSSKLQPNKKILIQEKKTGKVYSGYEARDVLGLPRDQEVRVRPGYSPDYEIFNQSTSVNRVLPVGSKVLNWSKSVS